MLRLIHFARQVMQPVCWRTTEYLQHPRLQNPVRCPQQHVQQESRYWYSCSPRLTNGEKAIVDKLKAKFPGAKAVEVSDISGGCGAMYQISIEAEEFRGKKTVLQHRMVNEALAEEIKVMHGLQITTKVPSDS